MPNKLNSLKPRVATMDTRKASSPAIERIRGHELQRIRERILLRDEYTCQACGRTSVHMEVDHKVPLYLGGSESDDNRQALCSACHEEKSKQEERGRGGSNL